MQTIEIARLGLAPGSHVLDLGCGNGRHARATRLLPGVAAVALDLGADEVVATAASLRSMDAGGPADGASAPGAGPWLVLRGNGYTLPFRDGAFDCIIAAEILEHLHEDDKALAEISRVLKPGGQLAVSVPRLGPEAICWALSGQYRSSAGGHVRIYRRGALVRKLAGHGYEVYATHHAHALHSPYWWLKCAVGVDNEDQRLVRWYHRLLIWDLMRRPRITRMVERALDPLIGKSVVLYAKKVGANGNGHRRTVYN